MRIVLLAVAFTGLIFRFPASGAGPPAPERPWVDSVYRALSGRERIGQLVGIRVHVDDGNAGAYQDTIVKYGIGSIVLTGGTPGAYSRLIRAMGREMSLPPLIVSKAYPRTGAPLDSAFRFPVMASLKKVKSFRLIRELAGEVVMQERCIQAGAYRTGFLNVNIDAFNMTLEGGMFSNYGELPGWSPAFHRLLADSGLVVDAGIRITGTESPERIAGALQSRSGFQSLRMRRLLGVKNFDRWMFTVEKIPFFNAAGAEQVQGKLVDGIIRKQFGNRTLVAADLESIQRDSPWKGTAGAAVTLLLGGMDLIVTGGNPGEVVDQIQKAVDDGRIRPRVLEEKVRRALRLKYLAGIRKPGLLNAGHFRDELNRPEAKQVAMKIFREAVAMQDGRIMHIPVHDSGPYYAASLTFGGQDLKVFRNTLEAYAPFVHFFLPSISCDPGSLTRVLDRLKTFDRVVVGFHAGDLSEAGQSVVDFFNRLSLRSKVTLVFFGDIANENDFSNRAAKVFVPEDHPFVQCLAAQMVFGGYLPPGYEPDSAVSPPPLAFGLPEEEQMDSRTLRKIDRIVKEAIRREDMPGCQVLVARNGQVIYNRAFGYYTYDSLRRVTQNAIYDLASLTKVAATTQLMMWLTGKGLIDPGKSIGYYLPELKGTNKENLLIRDILLHQAGLKPFYPFWRYTLVDREPDTVYYHRFRESPSDLVIVPGMYAPESLRDSVWQWTIDTKLLRKNKAGGYDYEYSDLGFYMLQKLIERVTGRRLDVLADSIFYRPMEMATMTYRPLCRFPADRIVPTEKDTYFRHCLIRGTVHDPVAAMMGGVAGHAGLFSNAQDLAKLMQMNLNGGKYDGHIYLKDSVVEQFITQKRENNRRSLGWDKPEREKGYNPASRYASWKTFGHRGFTGTAVWADPTFQLIYVFLSNRVYMDAAKRKTTDLNVRKRVHEVIYESMWDYQKAHNR